MKISTKISLIASTIILIAFSLFSIYQYYIAEKSLYERLENNIDETSVSLNYQITNWLNGKLAIINTLADMGSRTDNLEDIQKIIEVPEGKLAFQLVYYVSDSIGKSIFNDPELDIGDADGRERPWYMLAKSEVRATLTDAYMDETSEFPMISAVSSVRDHERTSKILGVVGGDISTQTVSSAMNKINFNNSGYVFLANQNGKIVIHPDLSFYNKDIFEMFSESIDFDNYTDLQHTVSRGGEDKLVKFKKISGLANKNWIIGIVIDKAIVSSETRALARNGLIAALISVILCSLILYLFMNKIIIAPIKSLTDKANNISMGRISDEVDPEYLLRKDEIGKLAEGFERMRKSLGIAINKINRIKKKSAQR